MHREGRDKAGASPAPHSPMDVVLEITMVQKLQITLYIVLFALHPLDKVPAFNKLAISNEDFIGTWKGEGRIIVAWCEQKQLSFECQIDMNGNVLGKIGDAQILNGKIRLKKMILSGTNVNLVKISI